MSTISDEARVFWGLDKLKLVASPDSALCQGCLFDGKRHCPLDPGEGAPECDVCAAGEFGMFGIWVPKE